MSFRQGTAQGLRSPVHEVALEVMREFARLSGGAELLIYCTLRTPEQQAILFRKGRTLKQIRRRAEQLQRLGRPDLSGILLAAPQQMSRKRVTNAGPGQSAHQYGIAFDAVPLDEGGKAIWRLADPLYQLYGQISTDLGLDWAGNWKRFKEGPHSQRMGFDWRAAIRRR
jgi:peptidoglycan L-alanyl-D-glutamate endopeptidase CwlK